MWEDGIDQVNILYRELEDCENIAFLMANADSTKLRSVVWCEEFEFWVEIIIWVVLLGLLGWEAELLILSDLTNKTCDY